MATGTYAVGQGSDAPSSRDASFKSCMCALLLFIAICSIVLLAGLKWSRNAVREDDKETEPQLQGSQRVTAKPTQTITTSYRVLSPKTKTATKTELNKIAATVTSALTSKITVTTGPIMTFTKLPNVVTSQTKSGDETILFSQDAYTTFKTLKNTTSNFSETEIQTTTQNIDKDKAYEDNSLNTGSSNESTEKATESYTTTVDNRETSTIVGSLFITKLHNIDRTASLITGDLSDYTQSEPVETTKDAPSEQPSTDATHTDFMHLIFTQNATQKPSATSVLALLLKPTVFESTAATITKKDWRRYEEGQKLVEDYEYFDDNLNTPTTVKTNPTEKKYVIMPYRPEKINTTTDSTVLFRKPDPVCLSVGCKSAASRMLSLMDHSVDPCNDFYEFACGKMLAVTADFDTWKMLSDEMYLINKTAPPYLQTFKTFYDSCVSHEYEFNYQKRIDGVLKLVKEVGKLFHEKPAKGTIDMTELFTKLLLRHSLPFMDIEIDIDKQSSNFILKLTLPRPTSVLKESGHWSALTEAQKRCLDDQRHELEQTNLDLSQIYESYLTCQEDHSIYIKSVETVVKVLGFFLNATNSFEESQKIQDLRTTIEWDVLDHLNTLPPPSARRQAMLLKEYTVFKISDLKIQYSLIDWSRLFKNVTGSHLDDSTTVQVYFQSYFSNIFQKLQDVDDWRLNNALVAIYVHSLYENLVIPQAKHTRENYCIKLSSKLFPDVSSSLYMNIWHEAEMKDSQTFLVDIFHRLKENLKEALQKEAWLDDASLTSALFKLHKMELTFNKPEDSYNNKTYLNSKYSAVTMTTDFQENAIKMLEMDRKMRYALIGKQYSTDYLWSYFVNTYDRVPTSFYSRLIMAPLGMVKQPVKGFPGYMTMARIGLALAREIGRHFDPVGIQNEITLTEDSQSMYQTLESIMENESLFDISKSIGDQTATFKADPKLSMNERIADNTGFRMISNNFDSVGDKILLPWVSTSFSIEQVFHITVAQEYCQNTDMPEFMQQLFESEILPASLRVENIMTNSKQFPKAFNCPRGSPMNNNPMKIQFPHLEEEEDDEEEL